MFNVYFSCLTVIVYILCVACRGAEWDRQDGAQCLFRFRRCRLMRCYLDAADATMALRVGVQTAVYVCECIGETVLACSMWIM